jgi:hypothetical protein
MADRQEMKRRAVMADRQEMERRAVMAGRQAGDEEEGSDGWQAGDEEEGSDGRQEMKKRASYSLIFTQTTLPASSPTIISRCGASGDQPQRLATGSHATPSERPSPSSSAQRWGRGESDQSFAEGLVFVSGPLLLVDVPSPDLDQHQR